MGHSRRLHLIGGGWPKFWGLAAEHPEVTFLLDGMMLLMVFVYR